MARIKESALVSGVRGTQGGNVFSAGHYGAYVRQKVSPTQPQSARQIAQRNIFTAQSQAWRNLTDDERNAWNAWAQTHPIMDVFGNAQVLTGAAAFMKVNADLVTLGMDPTDDPLPDPVTPPPAATAATIVAATGLVTVTLETAPLATNIYAVWQTPGLSPGVTYVSSMFRFGGQATLPTPPSTSLTITPVNLNALLVVTAGRRVGISVIRYTDEGLRIDATRFGPIAT
jgi:hypothetical protein